MSGRRSRLGFTLVELLVVIAILSIVSGTVLIRTNPFESEGRQELRQIRSFLRKHHARTLRTGNTITITFNANDNEIRVRDDENETSEVLSLNNWTLQNVDGSLQLKLNPYRTGNEEVVFQHASGRETQLRRDWITGFRTVQSDESS